MTKAIRYFYTMFWSKYELKLYAKICIYMTNRSSVIAFTKAIKVFKLTLVLTNERSKELMP